MESYNLIDGFNEHGEDIVLRPSWEHKTSELRFLAAAEDEEHPLVKVLSTTNFTKDGDAYTFHYPFEFAGLPWRVFAWRVTTENGSVDYTEGRVPVEAILTKISELSAKAEEFGLLYRRALKAPEDMAGKMIVPLKKLRLGKVLGFDDDGLPICGLKNIRETKEFLDEMKRILADLVANADKMLEEFAETAKRIMDEKVAEATEIADNARKICEALAKEIREIRDRIEKLYAELTRYRYEVLTREEYEAKKAAGTLEADVIYFVKGTVAINDTLERLEEALSSLSEAYAELSARHDADVAALEGTIQATSDALDAAFAEATAAIEALEGKHDAESLAATQRLNDLQGGLQTLKARVDALQEQADASTAGVAENAAGIADLQQSLTEKTDALRGLIDALTTQVGEGDAENNAVARGLLDRMDAAEAKNDEQDAGIAGNAGEIAALKAQLGAALNEDIPALLDFYTQAIADLQAKSGVATMTFSGTSKLSTATVMDVNDAVVGHDANGAMRVSSAGAAANGTVYLPESETSALSNAAASLKLLRKKANALSVEGGATSASDNSNQYSFVGPLTSLGVTGACADLNTVTFYRRANNTPNGSTQVYLRLLKKVVGSDGNKTWQIASQSVNAVAFSNTAINGDPCGTFYMKRVAGVEPPTCAETVALVMVGAADAEVNTSLQFGCKVAPSTTGGVCASIPIADAITSDKGGLAVVPMLDITWTPCANAVGDASYDAPGIVQLSLSATPIDDPLGIGKQSDGRIVGDMAQVRAVVNAAVSGVEAALDESVSELKEADAATNARIEALEAKHSVLGLGWFKPDASVEADATAGRLDDKRRILIGLDKTGKVSMLKYGSFGADGLWHDNTGVYAGIYVKRYDHEKQAWKAPVPAPHATGKTYAENTLDTMGILPWAGIRDAVLPDEINGVAFEQHVVKIPQFRFAKKYHVAIRWKSEASSTGYVDETGELKIALAEPPAEAFSIGFDADGTGTGVVTLTPEDFPVHDAFVVPDNAGGTREIDHIAVAKYFGTQLNCGGTQVMTSRPVASRNSAPNRGQATQYCENGNLGKLGSRYTECNSTAAQLQLIVDLMEVEFATRDIQSVNTGATKYDATIGMDYAQGWQHCNAENLDDFERRGLEGIRASGWVDYYGRLKTEYDRTSDPAAAETQSTGKEFLTRFCWRGIEGGLFCSATNFISDMELMCWASEEIPASLISADFAQELVAAGVATEDAETGVLTAVSGGCHIMAIRNPETPLSDIYRGTGYAASDRDAFVANYVETGKYRVVELIAPTGRDFTQHFESILFGMEWPQKTASESDGNVHGVDFGFWTAPSLKMRRLIAGGNCGSHTSYFGLRYVHADYSASSASWSAGSRACFIPNKA